MRIFYHFLEGSPLASHTLRRRYPRHRRRDAPQLPLPLLLCFAVELAFAQTLKCNLHKFHSFFRLYKADLYKYKYYVHNPTASMCECALVH